MTGNEAYAFLLETVGYDLDEANLQQGLETLGKKMTPLQKFDLADTIQQNAGGRRFDLQEKLVDAYRRDKAKGIQTPYSNSISDMRKHAYRAAMRSPSGQLERLATNYKSQRKWDK